MEPASKRSAAAGLLVAVAFLLPFEAPLFQLGPLVVTSAELPLYAAVAAWLAVARRPRNDALLLAALLLVAAVLCSALAAGGAAIKVALRFAAGALLFAAARDLARPRAVALAVCAGAAVAALGAVALPDGAALWAPFRAQGFSALGVARASGPFAYPTIAGMYWEASLPLAGALLLTGRRRWPGALALLALAGLLVTAIVLSATRAALAGALVAGLALLVLGWRAGPRLRLVAAGILAATLAVHAVALAGGGLLAHRLRWWRDDSWYGASYALAPALALPAGGTATVPITVANTGTVTWPRDAVDLSYHLEIDDGGWRMLEFDGMRTLLPADVAPGASVALQASVAVPARPGRYRLRWDLVRETVTWFSERGTPTADQLLQVTGAPVAAPPPPAALDPRARRTPTRPELWRAALALWRRHPLLGVGPDNFRHRYAEVLAPPPGELRFADERLHANSLYLETLADLGLAGAAALALLAVALARTLHAARRDALRLCFAVGAATFFVHGLVDTFLTFTPTYGLFWLLLGCAAQNEASASSSSAAT